MSDDMGDDVRLYLGDCLDILPTIDLGGVDAVVTDPPYGLGSTSARKRPSNYQRAKGQLPREWDAQPSQVAMLLDISPIVVIWGGNYFPLPPSRGWLVWNKPDAPPSMGSAELAWTNRDVNIRTISYSISATNRERVAHPTQKPVAVMRWCLKQLDLKPGMTILDPYMGAASIGVAALQLGLRYIGIDNVPEYHEIATGRINGQRSRYPLFEPRQCTMF